MILPSHWSYIVKQVMGRWVYTEFPKKKVSELTLPVVFSVHRHLASR